MALMAALRAAAPLKADQETFAPACWVPRISRGAFRSCPNLAGHLAQQEARCVGVLPSAALASPPGGVPRLQDRDDQPFRAGIDEPR